MLNKKNNWQNYLFVDIVAWKKINTRFISAKIYCEEGSTTYWFLNQQVTISRKVDDKRIKRKDRLSEFFWSQFNSLREELGIKTSFYQKWDEMEKHLQDSSPCRPEASTNVQTV